MAIRTVVTRGYGNGTFNGTIALVVTRGYAIAVPSAFIPAPTLRSTMQVIESYLLASGYFSTVLIGEPKDIMEGTGLTAAINLQGTRIVMVMAGGSVLKSYEVRVNIYRNLFAEPTGNIEFELAEAVSKSAEDLLGAYDLGSTISEIDVAGQFGVALNAQWGHATVAGKLYRVATLTVPLVVNDTVTAVA